MIFDLFKKRKQKKEQERVEQGRLERERAEKERLEQERAEKERLEQERAEKERLEQERAEKERLEQERAEKERLEQERAEKERLEQERAEKERLEQERAEKERLEQERAEKERLEQERVEQERLEQERAEKERLERERAEKERLEQERAEKERLEQERAEKERLEQERAEKERLEQERAEKERLEREAQQPSESPPPEDKTESSGLFSRLKSGLKKTRDILTTDINDLFTSAKAIDEDLFEELEELLITSDLGIDITMEIMERIRKQAKRLSGAEELKQVLKEELIALFPDDQANTTPLALPKPRVIMMVGVNGTGKTTTLGKLAMKYTRQGKKVLIAAADTFRAAAIEQVEIWAERSNASIVKHREGADPAAVAYDALEASMARGIDVLLIDTAGRLHTQKNLMEELKKIKRTVAKKMKGAPHEVLMVLDATTGQNAVSQAKIFNEAVGLSQIALTKLDGTAKGGIVAAVSSSMNIPISYIGVGEGIEDLQEFDAKRFINALFDA